MIEKFIKDYTTAMMGVCGTVITGVKTIELGGHYIKLGQVLIVVAVFAAIMQTICLAINIYRAHKEAKAKAEAEAKAKAKAIAKARAKAKRKRKKKRKRR